jgi:hypothetical protein
VILVTGGAQTALLYSIAHRNGSITLSWMLVRPVLADHELLRETISPVGFGTATMELRLSCWLIRDFNSNELN